ncbi:MAG: hypothetical protein ACTHNK_09840 [Thermomicrobiales bacterium]
MGAPSADLLAVPVLLVEVALLAVALAVARVPRLLRPARWLARGLALVSLLVGLGGMLSAVSEGWTSRYPLTLPDTPFGTYARPTTLEMVQLLLTFLVVAVAALLAFRRPGRAGLLFVGWGVSGALAWGLRQDPTRPPGNFMGMALTVALSVLAVGAVLLATWWAGGGRPPRVARRDVLVEAGTIAALAAAWLAIVGAAAAWGPGLGWPRHRCCCWPGRCAARRTAGWWRWTPGWPSSSPAASLWPGRSLPPRRRGGSSPPGWSRWSAFRSPGRSSSSVGRSARR